MDVYDEVDRRETEASEYRFSFIYWKLRLNMLIANRCAQLCINLDNDY